MKDKAVFGIKWATIYTAINLLGGRPIEDAIIRGVSTGVAVYSGVVIGVKMATTHPVAQASAIMDIIMLSLRLESIRVSTDAELLMESTEYHREYKLVLNENKLPQILQSKYIMIPTFDDGQIKDESIVQEHIIGSKEYVLSKGSPVKQYKLSFAGA